MLPENNIAASHQAGSRSGWDGILIGSLLGVAMMVVAGTAMLVFSDGFASAQQAMFDAMTTMADICRL